MNVAEAMAIVNSSNLARVGLDGSLRTEVRRLREAASVLRTEVERLRKACNQYSEDELLNGDWRARAEKAEAELAAVKAASVCPVRVLNIFEGTYESDRYIELRTDAEADTFTDWLRDRVQERGEG